MAITTARAYSIPFNAIKFDVKPVNSSTKIQDMSSC